MNEPASQAAPAPSLASALRFLDHRNAWWAAALGTLAMLAFFVLTLDAGAVHDAWQALTPRLLVIVALLISINGLLDAIWMTVITRAPQSQSYRVVAWHMMMSSVLPARLGDVGLMVCMHRWLAQPPARAVFVTLYHRLQDFIIVSLMLLLSLLVARTQLGGVPVLVAALLILLMMGVVCGNLGRLLGVLAALVLRLQRRFHHRWLRQVLTQVLHVRIWYRHRLTRRQVLWSFVVIVLRWVTILAALTLVIRSLATQVSAGDSFLLANAYVYFGIVPVQSIGGFGSGEAGLAWMLTHYGVPLAHASAVGLLLRLSINLVHMVLWALVVALLWLRGQRA
ncbi:MAG: flippase-like domain-containing protein [Gammaproteobacteria bacterium]|nr:flippase-like domain-containing protein [Gammaproteobacteria bacterium]